MSEEQKANIKTLTREQAAISAQVGLSSIDRAIRLGKLKVKKIGRRVIILESEFKRWLESD